MTYLSILRHVMFNRRVHYMQSQNGAGIAGSGIPASGGVGSSLQARNEHLLSSALREGLRSSHEMISRISHPMGVGHSPVGTQPINR